MDCSSGDLASKDLMYNILTLETNIVSITFLGSILRMNENTASRISASISCSLAAPALITAAKTYTENIFTIASAWKHEIVKITDTSSVQNKHSEEKVNVCVCTQECIRVREGGLYKGRSQRSLVAKNKNKIQY